MNKELEGRLIYFVSLPEESVHSHRLANWCHKAYES